MPTRPWCTRRRSVLVMTLAVALAVSGGLSRVAARTPVTTCGQTLDQPGERYEAFGKRTSGRLTEGITRAPPTPLTRAGQSRMYHRD